MINLCAPAIIYLIFSITQIIIDTFKGLYNTAFMKSIVMIMVTLLLNILCERGLSVVSWIIVFIPFIFMTVIVAMLLYIFGLDAATGTINFDTITQSILYYTSNSSANFTLNFRGDSGTLLNALMSTGSSITLVFMNTNGSTAYYPTAITIDGNAVTPKIQGGTAITSGNASSIDSYSITIIKTANATFTVLEAQTKFA